MPSQNAEPPGDPDSSATDHFRVEVDVGFSSITPPPPDASLYPIRYRSDSEGNSLERQIDTFGSAVFDGQETAYVRTSQVAGVVARLLAAGHDVEVVDHRTVPDALSPDQIEVEFAEDQYREMADAVVHNFHGRIMTTGPSDTLARIALPG